MNQEQIDVIWKKTDVLINHFRKYNLEKKISKFAIDYLNSNKIQPLLKQEEEATKKTAEEEEAIKKTAEEEEIQQLEEPNETTRQQILQKANEHILKEVIEDKSKKTAEEEGIQQLEESNENAIQEPTGAMNDVNDEIKNKIILQFIKKHLPLIKTLIAIKNTAINALQKKYSQEPTGAINTFNDKIKNVAIEVVNTKTIENQLLLIQEEFEKINKQIQNSEKIDLNQPAQNFIETYNNLLASMADKDKQIDELNNALNKLNVTLNNQDITESRYSRDLHNIIDKLKQSILQKELENVAKIKLLSRLTTLPERTQPIVNVTPENESVSRNILIRYLEDTAKNKLENIINDKTVPVSITGYTSINIENDLKHTALMALYNKLPTVARTTIDVSKPPTNYDVLITDKTYKYENGKPIEIPELTKYDSILA